MALKFLNDGFFDGKVGIGTATPDAKLQVVQTASANAATFENITQTQSVVTIKTAEVLNNASVLTFSVGDNLASTDIFAQINGKVVSDGGTLKGDLIFQTNQGDDVEERMRISASGNVGIGTGNPIASYDRTLHVKGVNPTVRIETDSATGWAYNQYKSPQSIWSTGIEAFDKFVITNSADLDTNIRFCIDDLNGKVGIGTTTPEYKLHVNSDDASDDVTFIHHNSAGQTSGNVLRVLSDAGDNTGSALLNVGNGTGFAMYARGDRRVGIGTNTPDAGLAVKGLLSLALSGTITISNSSNAVTGTNTAFLTELKIKDAIKIGAEIFTISAIGSNTSLTLDSNVSIASTNVTAFMDPALLSVKNGDNGVKVFVNKSGKIGIGTTSPNAKLDIKETTSDVAGEIIVGGLIDTDTDDVAFGKLNFANTNVANTQTNDILASIAGEKPDSSNRGELVFRTSNDAAPAERMRIDNEGNVRIGAGNPGAKLDVVGSVNNADIAVRITNTFDDDNASSEPTAALLLEAVSSNAYLRVHGAPTDIPASHKIDLGSTASNSFLTFSPSDSEKMRIDKDGNVGIGTTSPDYPLEVNDRIAIKGSTVPQLMFFETDSTYTDAMRLLRLGDKLSLTYGWNVDEEALTVVGGTGSDIGFVGIGTTSPAAKLHVKDTTATAVTLLQLESTYNSPSGNKSIYWSDETDNVGRISVDYTNPMGKMRFGSLFNTTAQTADVMVLQGDGNVGIGTSSPLSNLHIETTNSSAYIQLRRNFTGSKGRLFLGSESAANIIASQGDATTDAKPLVFKIAETEKMRIDDTGNVGIKTTNPLFALDITEATAETNTLKDVLRLSHVTSGTAASGLGAGILFSAERALNGFNLSRGAIYGVSGPNENDDGDLVFHTRTDTAPDSATAGMNEKMRITHDGNVGIGTDSPLTAGGDAKWLTMAGKSTSTYSGGLIYTIGAERNAFTYFESDYLTQQAQAGFGQKFKVNNSNTAMTILSGGNVGIGETNPTALLHISGIQDPNVKIQDLDGTNQFSSVGHNNGDMTFVSRNNTADGKFTWYGGGGGTITTRMTLDLDGKLGIGEANPGEKLDVKGGNIRLVDASAGLIFTAPNGKLWKMTISNTGVPVYTDISPQ